WAVLDTLNIPYIKVSRTKGEINYTRLAQTDDLINTHRLIINTTPLGMSPNTSSCPPLPYEKFNEKYYLYDLVYNPLDTLFMQKGREYGARVKNGLEMLHLQAEKSWDIWNE
ncbi:MAG: shikimate dehydrogenase, partial [Cyclobacteriaceae bacterium]|nr:shikimate dehydrogenase [Cyclobacteriaceae bacterium]